jgi:glycine cleavage system aminomethyltransferase T
MQPVIRQSAVWHKQQQLGGFWTDYHGWQVAAAFRSAEEEAAQASHGVGLADLSWMAKFDLKGSGLKTMPPVPPAARCWTLGPLHLLLTCLPEMRDAVRQRISALDSVYVTDMTSVFAQLLLVGPQSFQVLSKLTSLNVEGLPDLECLQGSVAHVRAIVQRENIGQLPAFHLLVGCEYSEGVWDAIVHAGHEFHLSAFGLKAWELLRR